MCHSLCKVLCMHLLMESSPEQFERGTMIPCIDKETEARRHYVACPILAGKVCTQAFDSKNFFAEKNSSTWSLAQSDFGSKEF